MGVIWASEAEHVGVAISIVNINQKQWKLRRPPFRTAAGWSFARTKRSSSRPTLAKARGEPGPITTGGDYGSPLSRGRQMAKCPLGSFRQNASRSRIPGAAQHEVVRCRHRSRVYPRSAMKCAQVGQTRLAWTVPFRGGPGSAVHRSALYPP